MHCGRGGVAVVGENSFEVEYQRFPHAALHEFRTGIQEAGRKMREGTIAGEEVRSEEELEFFAVPAGVAVGMPG